jgi:hypothetical protein
MTDEQAAAQPAAEAAPADDALEQMGANVESLRVTVDAEGMVVPDGDPAGQTVLTGQDAADAMKATAKAGKGPKAAEATAADDAKAQRGAESKAQKAPPEDKGR